MIFLCCISLCLHSEEELLYLSFIEDVTDEILKLGLFSNRLDFFNCVMVVE